MQDYFAEACHFKRKTYLCSPFEKTAKLINLKVNMYLTAEKKTEIFTTYGKSAKDTGSSEAQIALFTQRINFLTGHMKKSPKDKHTQRSLVNLVGKRKSLLDYLKKTDIERYRAVIKKLDIRK